MEYSKCNIEYFKCNADRILSKIQPGLQKEPLDSQGWIRQYSKCWQVIMYIYIIYICISSTLAYLVITQVASTRSLISLRESERVANLIIIRVPLGLGYTKWDSGLPCPLRFPTQSLLPWSSLFSTSAITSVFACFCSWSLLARCFGFCRCFQRWATSLSPLLSSWTQKSWLVRM